MARVDFYVLHEPDGDSRLRLACRLAEKACTQQRTVFLLASSADEAHRLDELLWTFHDRSFVPHALAHSPEAGGVPVLIGTDLHPAAGADVLINLASAVPAGYQRFERIVELVDGDGERRRQGRERFRYYREHGEELHSHDIGASDEP